MKHGIVRVLLGCGSIIAVAPVGAVTSKEDLGVSCIFRTYQCASATQAVDALLIKAAQQGRLRKVSALLARGAQVDATQENGWTALMLAVQNRQEAVVRLLLDRGADPKRHPTAYFDTTPLILAAQAGDVEIAGLLLARGADVNGRDDTGGTALMYVAGDTNLPPTSVFRMVRFLLEHNADVHAKDDLGNTALSTARNSLRMEKSLSPTVHLLETKS